MRNAEKHLVTRETCYFPLASFVQLKASHPRACGRSRTSLNLSFFQNIFSESKSFAQNTLFGCPPKIGTRPHLTTTSKKMKWRRNSKCERCLQCSD